jgi:Trk-type K+ transport system membrane component
MYRPPTQTQYAQTVFAMFIGGFSFPRVYSHYTATWGHGWKVAELPILLLLPAFVVWTSHVSVNWWRRN